ncbi:MAG: hypothetical protein QOF58_3381 [Pseudonocardiales bacterium]|jgi:hypothetical protein|nr:hypothetical protein [Pseudonocardiales bacterium]
MAISSRFDTTRVLATVLLPTLAKGGKLQATAVAIRTMRHLRDRYGPEPVRLRITGRSVAMLVDPTDVGRLLTQSPEPFALVSKEKKAPLDQFQPPGKCDVDPIVRDEADLLTRHVMSTGELTWDTFTQTWWRIVRRIVLGDRAREDTQLTGEVKTLWQNAFDAAAIVTVRALAIGARGTHGILESARLWPTTPMILRKSTIATRWHGTWLPEGTEFVVFTPFFHRDPDRLPFADRYAPEIWDQPLDPAIVPFLDEIPGRDLVLATATAMLDALSEHLTFPKLAEPLPATLNHVALRMPATPVGTRAS